MLDISKKENLLNFWNDLQPIVSKQLDSASSYSLYVSQVEPFVYDDATKSISFLCPNTLIQTIFEERYKGILQTTISDVLGENINVSFTSSKPKTPASTNTPQEPTTSVASTYNTTNLLPQYTFDNFITDDQNRLVKAVGQAISSKLNNKYNPFFIYGNSGLGKTHILHAIGNEYQKNFPEKKALYISSEEFTLDYITATQTNSIASFKNKYRTVDILLLDDIQFIDSTKEKTSEEIFHTYNTLYNLNKQLVFSSDRPPDEILGIDKRLSSRLASQGIFNISAPIIETRIAILKNIALQQNIPLTTEVNDVIDFIASKIKNNIRELLGAFNRVITYSIFTEDAITLSIAKTQLSDIIKEENIITPEQIISVACQYFGLKSEVLKSKKKTNDVAFARQITIFLIKTHTNTTYKQIGFLLGGRDHSTIMHSYEKIKGSLKQQKVAACISSIETILF